MDGQWTSCRVQALNPESTANAARRKVSLDMASAFAKHSRVLPSRAALVSCLEISHSFLVASASKPALGV